MTVGESVDLALSIQNAGGGALSGSITENCADFSIVGDASYNLSAGQADTLAIRFSPTTEGAKSCTLETGSALCADVPLNGSGFLATACEVLPSILNFGTITVGQSGDLAFTIRNTGGGILAGTVTEACAEFSIIGGAAYALAAGQIDTLTIRFAPTSEGSKNCAIETGASACPDIAATGEGFLATACLVAPTTLDFGTVTLGQSSDMAFTVQNTGGGTLSGTISETCADFSIVGDAAFSLTAAQIDTFAVRFAPVSEGAKNCTIDTGVEGCTDVAVGGVGFLAPACDVTSTTLNFGTVPVGQSSDMTFTIQNTGGSTLSGTITESCADFSIVGDAGYSLAAGQRDTLTVRFAPVTEGAKSCTIETGSGGCADVSANGDGFLATMCELSPTTLSFGTLTVGQSADLTFTIQNTGGSTLGGTVTEDCPDFAIVGDAAFNLTAGQRDTITVRFAPLTEGLKNCTIDTGGSGCPNVSTNGTGFVAPACQVTPTNLDFEDVIVGQSADLTFAIENTGGGTLSGSVTENCPDFSIIGGASYSLTAGQTDTISVRFSPASGGAKNCTIETGAQACSDILANGSATALAKWTVMVYLAADNTLNFAGIGDIDEMEAAGVSPDVNVVVEAEFSSQQMSLLGLTPAYFNRPNYNTFRYVVSDQGSPTPGPNGATIDIGNRDMTDPSELNEFISWARSNYPAEHYALVLWNHGGGYLGLIQDATSAGGDLMSLGELPVALAGVSPIDIVDFDMCLMAGYETLLELGGYADFAIFSEEVVPGEGNPYQEIIDGIQQNPSATPRAVAQVFVNEFHDSYLGAQASTTKSAYELSQFSAFESALDALAVTLRSNRVALTPAIEQAALMSQAYDFPQLKDCVDFLNLLGAATDDAMLQQKIDAVIAAATGSFRVLNRARTGSGAGVNGGANDVSRSNGLNILMPSGGATDRLPDAGSGSFASYQAQFGDAEWTQFLAEWLEGQSTAAFTDLGDAPFEGYLVWNPAAVTAGVDIDLWIVEPNGNLYIPWLGSVTPNGSLTNDSYLDGTYYEGYLTHRFVENGTYYFYANLFADPSDYRPLYDLSWRYGQSAPFNSLYSPNFPQLSTLVSWLADPSPTFAEINGGSYTDLRVAATLTLGGGAPGKKATATPSSDVSAQAPKLSGRITTEQLAAVKTRAKSATRSELIWRGSSPTALDRATERGSR